MNRRRFLELLGTAAAGSYVAYSFPSIIVPKNIGPRAWYTAEGYLRKQGYNLAAMAETESMWAYPTQYALNLNSFLRLAGGSEGLITLKQRDPELLAQVATDFGVK